MTSIPTSAGELKPCPFCGNAPRLTDYYGNYNKPPEHVVHCDTCDLSLDGMPSPEEAVALWNRRSALIPPSRAEPVSAPERIRVAQDADGFWTCREAVSGSPEYVRADLVPPQAVAPTGEIAGLIDRLNALVDCGCLEDAEAIYEGGAALTALSAKLAEVERRGVIRFAQAILHGDDEHRTWLMDAAIAFVAGKPLPPPNGKGRAEAAEAEATDLCRKLEEARKALAEARDHINRYADTAVEHDLIARIDALTSGGGEQ